MEICVLIHNKPNVFALFGTVMCLVLSRQLKKIHPHNTCKYNEQEFFLKAKFH